MMQRKPAPGFPANSCSIRMPDVTSTMESVSEEADVDQQLRRQQLINYAHSHWGFKNWSWAVTKQELDFVDFGNGKYSAGVVAFVSVTVKSMDIHREDIGYATTQACKKGLAIFQARKCAVTNALRETLLSFGGTFAIGLVELLESHKTESVKSQPSEWLQENNQNTANKDTTVVKNAANLRNVRKDSTESNGPRDIPAVRSPNKNIPPPANKASVPVAKTQPMPAVVAPPPPRPTLPSAVPHAPLRHNPNVSFVMMPSVMYPPPPPRMTLPPHQHVFPNYYEYAPTPWHMYDGYDRHHGNVNLNFNMPPKNLVVNGRTGTVECKNSCGSGRAGGEEGPPQGPPSHPHAPYSGPSGACWVKPSIFYDGFWTEQKVKRWVAEQVEKQFPDAPPVVPPAAPRPPTNTPPAPTH